MKQEQMLMIALAFLAGYFLNRLMGREGWSDADWKVGWPRDSSSVRTIHLGEQVTDWTNCNQVAVEYDDELAVDLGAPALGANFCNSKAEDCLSDKVSEYISQGADEQTANMLAIPYCIGTSDTSQYTNSGGNLPPPPPPPPPPLPEDCDDISELFNKYKAINDACSPGASCSSTPACQMAAYHFGDGCLEMAASMGMADAIQMAAWRAPCSTTPHPHSVHSGGRRRRGHRGRL